MASTEYFASTLGKKARMYSLITPTHNGLILTELEYSGRECWRRSRS